MQHVRNYMRLTDEQRAIVDEYTGLLAHKNKEGLTRNGQGNRAR